MYIKLPEVVGFANVPIFESNGSSICHPEESSFFTLIGPRGPEMFVTQSKIFDMFF